jgi:hypothetical protein
MGFNLIGLDWIGLDWIGLSLVELTIFWRSECSSVSEGFLASFWQKPTHPASLGKGEGRKARVSLRPTFFPDFRIENLGKKVGRNAKKSAWRVIAPRLKLRLNRIVARCPVFLLTP